MSMNTDRLKEFYEADASRFWDPAAGFTGRDLDIQPFLRDAHGVLLEYGCGSGSLLLNLAKQARFTKCYGFDISSKALETIGQAWRQQPGQAPGKLELSLPDHDRIPQIPDNTIDTLISVATVEHVIDPYIVLDELYRVAKPDANLICSVPNYAYLKHRLQILFGIQPRTGTDEPVCNWRHAGWDGMHLHTFTQSSFATLLEDCGWKPVKWLGCGQKFNSIGFGLLRRNFPGLFSGELIALCKKK